MTYRNDHDAALARIDSLEQELELAKVPPPAPMPPKQYATRVAIVASLLAAIAGGAWVYQRETSQRPSRDVAITEPAARVTPVDRLRHCLGVVQSARTEGYDARTTDPHGRARSVDGIEAIGAPCRRELADVVTTIGLTPEQRAAFQRWLAAEDTLAGDLSRIQVYYANDPYKLDNYSTAPQLWREFQTDRAARDATLPAVVRELQDQLPNS